MVGLYIVTFAGSPILTPRVPAEHVFVVVRYLSLEIFLVGYVREYQLSAFVVPGSDLIVKGNAVYVCGVGVGKRMEATRTDVKGSKVRSDHTV